MKSDQGTQGANVLRTEVCLARNIMHMIRWDYAGDSWNNVGCQWCRGTAAELVAVESFPFCIYGPSDKGGRSTLQIHFGKDQAKGNQHETLVVSVPIIRRG